jgi:hypothetical protein
MPRRARILSVFVATALLAGLATTVVARAADSDELSPKDDNGAAGRNGFPGNAGHLEPVKACNEQLHDTDASQVLPGVHVRRVHLSPARLHPQSPPLSRALPAARWRR